MVLFAFCIGALIGAVFVYTVGFGAWNERGRGNPGAVLSFADATESPMDPLIEALLTIIAPTASLTPYPTHTVNPATMTARAEPTPTTANYCNAVDEGTPCRMPPHSPTPIPTCGPGNIPDQTCIK